MGWASAVKAEKVNNHPRSMPEKVAIRRAVLDAVEDAHVFDAFAGSGRMWRAVWRQADSYVGCDLKWYKDRERKAFAADNRRVLRAIDLSGFNVFDLDAYGSPWEQALIIAVRRRVELGESIGVVLTEGSLMKIKLGQLPTALAKLSGVTGGMKGMTSHYEGIIERAIAGMAERMRCRIVRRWDAKGKTQAGVRYISLCLVGISDAERSAEDCDIHLEGMAADPS